MLRPLCGLSASPDTTIFLIEVLKRVAAEVGATPAQLALVWPSRQLNIIEAKLPGAVSRDASEMVKMPA